MIATRCSLLSCLHNSGAKFRWLGEAVTLDSETLRRYGQALKSSPEERVRLLEGCWAALKCTQRGVPFGRMGWLNLLAERSYGRSMDGSVNSRFLSAYFVKAIAVFFSTPAGDYRCEPSYSGGVRPLDLWQWKWPHLGRKWRVGVAEKEHLEAQTSEGDGSGESLMHLVNLRRTDSKGPWSENSLPRYLVKSRFLERMSRLRALKASESGKTQVGVRR